MKIVGCPKCGFLQQISDEENNNKIKCPECGNTFKVWIDFDKVSEKKNNKKSKDRTLSQEEPDEEFKPDIIKQNKNYREIETGELANQGQKRPLKRMEIARDVFEIVEFGLALSLAIWVSLGAPWWVYCYRLPLALAAMGIMAPPPRINYYGQITQPHGCTCLIAVGLGLGAFWGEWIVLTGFLLLAYFLRGMFFHIFIHFLSDYLKTSGKSES